MMPGRSRRVAVFGLVVLLSVWCGFSRVSAKIPEQKKSGEADAAVAAPPDTLETVSDWSGVTVVTKNGWNFPDVTISWVPEGNVARLRVQERDGSYQDWEAGEIASVRNAKGVDVTMVVAQAKPDLGGESEAQARQPEYNEVGAPAQDAPVLDTFGSMDLLSDFKMAYGFGLVFAHSLWGGWYDGVKGGLGLQADLRVAVKRRNYLNLLVQYENFGVDDIYYRDFSTDAIYRVKADYSRASVFLLAGSHGAAKKQGAIKMYFEAGVGFCSHRISSPADSITLGRMGWMLRLGLWAPLGETNKLDIGLSLDSKEHTLMHTDEAGGAMLSVHAGMTFF